MRFVREKREERGGRTGRLADDGRECRQRPDENVLANTHPHPPHEGLSSYPSAYRPRRALRARRTHLSLARSAAGRSPLEPPQGPHPLAEVQVLDRLAQLGLALLPGRVRVRDRMVGRWRGVGEVRQEEEEERGDDEGFVAVADELKIERLAVEHVGEERAHGVDDGHEQQPDNVPLLGRVVVEGLVPDAHEVRLWV